MKMKKIYPTELIDFLQCRHMAYLKKSGIQGEDNFSEEVRLLRQKGLEHEENFLKSLEGEVIEIDSDAPLEEQSRLTREAISEGKQYIYQAYLENDTLAGYPDFMEKIAKPSDLGDFSYRILDTKLSNTPSAANAVQLIHYSEIAEEIQGAPLDDLLVVHGNKEESEIRKSDYYDYYKELLREYENFIKVDEPTEPFPVSYCKSCSYQNYCQQYWKDNDHLAQVNKIKLAELEKFKAAGIKSLEELGKVSWEEGSGFSRNQFNELKLQAEAQKSGQLLLKDEVTFLGLKNLTAGGVLLNIFKNFQAAQGASSFYFGLKTLGGERFEELFIANSAEELSSFQRIISFVMRYLDKKPNAYFMVWSSADIKFIHDLSNKYNICHDEVDSLIFNKRLISVQSLLSSAFYLPVQENSLLSLYQLLEDDEELSTSLSKSPQLLNELRMSGSVENSEEMISNRAKVELCVMEAVLIKLSAYEKNDFPVNLLIDGND